MADDATRFADDHVEILANPSTRQPTVFAILIAANYDFSWHHLHAHMEREREGIYQI